MKIWLTDSSTSQVLHISAPGDHYTFFCNLDDQSASELLSSVLDDKHIWINSQVIIRDVISCNKI